MERKEKADMKITYIHHSSFLVELSHIVLLFDYYEGKLPQLPEDKALYVFASHSHSDHYGPVIFTLAEERENVYYILSKDINKRQAPDKLKERVYFVKAGERLLLEGEQETVEVETFQSTDEGVAFWVATEGKQLYHAGDLNNWWWEGEDKAWLHNMEAIYHREIGKMAGRRADAAFIPLDPRLMQQFYLGMDDFMKKIQADAVFPMHFWEKYEIIEQMKNHPCSEAYRDKIMEIHRKGEEFTL